MLPNLFTIVSRHPYPEFRDWWPMGDPFWAMMAESIVAEWRPLVLYLEGIEIVQAMIDEYVSLVYQREARPGLAARFAASTNLDTIQSGEFDALSYAFFRSAFESLASLHDGDEQRIARRQFTERVGARFFALLSDHLALDLPNALQSRVDFARVCAAIQKTGDFLHAQGYLRSHFAFHFDVTATGSGGDVNQRESDFLQALDSQGVAYALYEMGHPVILPSAVYLYRTIGEAQHHSSRTIEELFARVGCDAWETDDFDPTTYPSELVVELWQIRRRRPL